MNPTRDPDRLIHAFMLEGAEQLHDQVYDAVRADIEHRRQRVFIGPWRFPAMNKLVPIGLGAAALVAAVVVGARLLGPPASGDVGGAPSTSPSSSAAPSQSLVAPSSSTQAGLPVGPFVYEPGRSLPSINVTIPAPGWSFDREFEVLGKGDEVDNLPEAAILLWSWPAGTAFEVYGDPCHWASTRPETPATTVEDFAAALAVQPLREASNPVDVTIGGYAGKSVTLHVPDDIDFSASSPCDQDNFASYGIAGDTGPSRYHQGPGQIDELWILNIEGATVVLDATYRRDSGPVLLDEMRAIVESATFELP